jgi:Tol biopolymer transport system component
MGEVYKARDTRLDRTVAIKILAPGADDAAALRERFEREARAISQLNHPNVCTLYDIGEQPPSGPAGSPVRYLVMEFVEGETLGARLERGPLPIDQALTCATQIADALDKVHRKGIVHGDLKPGNIMLTKAGVKLLDFGLARQLRTRPPTGWPEASTRTVPIAIGSVLGTLQYLAPEQLEGEESDSRSDIFACGAVIYEMVTGLKAFPGDSHAAVMASIMKHHPAPLSAVQPSATPALEHAVTTCLAKDPDARWQHAGDLARELEWIASGTAAAAHSHRSPRPSMWMAAAGVLLLVAGAVAAYLYLQRQGTPAAPASRTSILLPEGLRFPGAGELGGIERFAMSPDGRQIAFVAEDPNGNQMLWLRPLDSLLARPLPGTDNATSPFWSPDSSRIAFVARGELKVITPGSGLPRVIASPASNTSGAWNSDDVILFTPSPFSPLHRVPAAGGTPEPVTRLERTRAEILHRNPFFLPGGQHFLYVAVSAPEGETAGARGLYVGALGGGEATRVFENGSIAKYADGRLLFVRDNRLLAQAFDTRTFTPSGEPAVVAEQIELIGPSSGAFTVSAAGVLAYQRSSGPGSQLVWFARDGRQLGALGEPGRYGDLELSPDGSQALVSLLDPTINTRDLWMIDVERGVRTKFTFDRADEVSPIWAPDGTRVAFTSNREGHFDLYQKAASGIGSEVLVLADDNEKYPTAWLPNRNAIMFWTFDENGTRLSLASLEGEEAPETVLDGSVNQGRLSPDGRWLAYYSGQSGRLEVYVVPYPEASDRWQVSINGGSYPRWTRGGREILFAGPDNRLMSVAVEPRGNRLSVQTPVPLFDVRPVTPRSFFAPAPEGDRVLVNMQQSDSRSTSITVVQSWSAALRP